MLGTFVKNGRCCIFEHLGEILDHLAVDRLNRFLSFFDHVGHRVLGVQLEEFSCHNIHQGFECFVLELDISAKEFGLILLPQFFLVIIPGRFNWLSLFNFVALRILLADSPLDLNFWHMF